MSVTYHVNIHIHFDMIWFCYNHENSEKQYHFVLNDRKIEYYFI